MKLRKYIGILLFLLPVLGNAQVTIKGVVKDSQGNPVEEAEVFLESTSYSSTTNNKGQYVLKNVKQGNYKLVAFALGRATGSQTIVIDDSKKILIANFELQEISQELDQVVIQAEKDQTSGIRRLRAVEGSSIYEAKKNEVIELTDITANLSVNNSRQVYARVPGLNIWESDGAGLQLGIGARGLDPSRTANFNVRQNGYDISADALGYPESYYTPATEAVERIEVVRGAASLQYGTQFGGLLNFVMKEGPEDKKLETTLRNTVGSYGFYNSFVSAGGTIDKINYYSYFQYKRGNGWRENTGFDSKMAYAAVKFEPSYRFKTSFEYTYLDYLAQQPGGLTDQEFNQNPRQSKRSRNWFGVNWNLFANTIDFKISDRFKVNLRNFALLASKDALGNLGRIDRPDVLEEERNLFSDEFNNWGSELRLLYNYQLFNQPSVLLVGSRYYKGHTDRKQGLANSSSNPDFQFLNPDQLEDSDYSFPNTNLSVFAENIFNITDKFSITPGVRFEHINTEADGYYTRVRLVRDEVTGQAVEEMYEIEEVRSRDRSFLFYGLGLSYKLKNNELYANFSQNYKAINFNDIRVNNPNLIVDSNIQDEFGYNFDLGIRGQKQGKYNFDVSLFYLRYNDRISTIQVVDTTNFRLLRYRSNISDAQSYGIEAYGELDILDALAWSSNDQLNWFVNLSLINSSYLSSADVSTNNAIKGNNLELVPPVTMRSGLSYQKNQFKLTYQFSYTQEHFTDATNAKSDPTAVAGIIPSYYVMDLSASYEYKLAKIEASINNLTNNYYFTRRAAGYPGPGIIPADGRTFYLTLQFKF